MKTLTKYRRACGTIIGQAVVPDDDDFYRSTAEVGIYAGAADPATQFVTSDGQLGTRVVPAGVSLSAPTITLGGSVIVTGLPAGWLRVRGEFVPVSGSYTFTPDDLGEHTLELVGGYRGSVTVTVNSAIEAARELDPRWAALKSATPVQIDNWLAANVTNIAQARDVLKTILLALRALHDRR